MDSIGFTDTISIPSNTNKVCLLHQWHRKSSRCQFLLSSTPINIHTVQPSAPC